MGCTQSSSNSNLTREERTLLNRNKKMSKKINEMLKKEREEIVRVPLVGIDLSGKSTVLKQIKILFEDGYSQRECLEYIPVIYSNTVQSLTAILKAMEPLNISFAEPSREEDAAEFLEVIGDGGFIDIVSLNDKLVAVMKRLWEDGGVQQCFRKGDEYNLITSAGYFLNSLQRIGASDYFPTECDILQATDSRSKGFQTVFTYKNIKSMWFEEGTSRPDRRHSIMVPSMMFDVFVFCVGLDAYDQLLTEDTSKTMIHASMDAFKSVYKNEWCKNKPIILFLNRKDLFAFKIASSPLTACFPDYTGPNTFEDTATYIKDKFLELDGEKRIIGSYFTCALDGTEMKLVLESVIDSISTNRTKIL